MRSMPLKVYNNGNHGISELPRNSVTPSVLVCTEPILVSLGAACRIDTRPRPIVVPWCTVDRSWSWRRIIRDSGTGAACSSRGTPLNQSASCLAHRGVRLGRGIVDRGESSTSPVPQSCPAHHIYFLLQAIAMIVVSRLDALGR